MYSSAGFNPGYDYVNGNVNEIHMPLEESIDWTEFVTTQDVNGQPITSTNSRTRVRMIMPLEVPGFQLRAIEANERLPSQTTSQDTYELEIGSTAFILIKVDQAIARSEAMASYLSQIAVGAEQNRVKLMLRYASELMSTGVDARNMGATAGPSSIYNLGTVKEPLSWSADNLFTITTSVKIILQDTRSWTEGQMFAIIPLEGTAAVEGAIRTNLVASTSRDEKFHVTMPKQFDGINFIVDMERTLYRTMKSNKPVYEIIFGNRNATLLYCSPISIETGGNADLQVLHDFVRCLVSFGGAVIKPSALASVIAAIDTPKVLTVA